MMRARLPRWSAALALALCWTAATDAQAPAAAAREPDTFAAMQRAQAAATAKLARSPRRHRWVAIPFGNRIIRAFVTFPQGRRTAPVVLVLHEVFGLTDSTRNTADEIAAMGYVTIAPDMLSGLAPDGGGTSHFATGRAAADMETAVPDATVDGAINAIAAYGLRLRGADPSKLAVVGLSWGGGAAFRYAAAGRAHPALRGVATFYDIGPPQETQGPAKAPPEQFALPVTGISVPILAFYPTRDTRVMRSLDATKAAMAAAGKPFDPVVLQDADHAYMRLGENAGDADPADAVALRQSLERLRLFLGGL